MCECFPATLTNQIFYVIFIYYISVIPFYEFEVIIKLSYRETSGLWSLAWTGHFHGNYAHKPQ